MVAVLRVSSFVEHIYKGFYKGFGFLEHCSGAEGEDIRSCDGAVR